MYLMEHLLSKISLLFTFVFKFQKESHKILRTYALSVYIIQLILSFSW